MEMYKVKFSKTGERDLQRLTNPLYERIKKKILSLKKDSRPRGTKKMKSEVDRFRIRIGNYRILYGIDDQNQVVTIYRIAHRSEAYR